MRRTFPPLVVICICAFVACGALSCSPKTAPSSPAPGGWAGSMEYTDYSSLGDGRTFVFTSSNVIWARASASTPSDLKGGTVYKTESGSVTVRASIAENGCSSSGVDTFDLAPGDPSTLFSNRATNQTPGYEGYIIRTFILKVTKTCPGVPNTDESVPVTLSLAINGTFDGGTRTVQETHVVGTHQDTRPTGVLTSHWDFAGFTVIQ